MNVAGTGNEASRLLKWTIEEETGIHLRNLEVEFQGDQVLATLADRVLARTEADDGLLDDPTALAEALHLSLGSNLHEHLVELERARLEKALVPDVERRIRVALSGTGATPPAELELAVVALPYRYRHGEPEEAQERGYPPFGVRVRGEEPGADLTVELKREPPDPERLSGEIVRGILEGGDRDG